MAAPDGGVAVMAGVLLDDGTNLYGIGWGSGQRLARTAASIDWAIEERFEGTDPPGEQEKIATAWAMLIEAMAASAKATRAMLGEQ